MLCIQRTGDCMESREPFTQADYVVLLIREKLAGGQSVRYLPFRGVSMLPLLRQGKDAVELSPLPEKLKKYDLPVYQYPSGKVVMHRVVEVREGYYVCLGDNTYHYETVMPEYCVALVTAIRRGNKVISTDSVRYQLYSRVWVTIYPLRRWLHKTYHGLRTFVKRYVIKFRKS